MAMIQFGYIILLLLCGGLMGTVFDLYNTVTGASKWLRWLRPTLDLAFWIVSALAVYYVVFVTDDGRLRFYTFILLLLGYLLYRFSFHHTVVSSAFAIVRLIAFVVRLVYRIVDSLLLRPLRIIWLVVKGLCLRLYEFFCVVENGLFWILRFWTRILKWPVAGRWAWTAKLQMIFAAYWEVFWIQMSKWLKKRTTET